MKFLKMHGLGNDFVLVDARTKSIKLTKKQIQKIADRKTGVGFDQLLLLTRSRNFDAQMLIFNTDGSRAEMCGNGLRAAGLYLIQKDKKKSFRILTDAGPRTVSATKSKNIQTCSMGKVKTKVLPQKVADYVTLNIRPMKFCFVDVGNPHLVLFFERMPQEKQFVEWAKLLETSVPDRTNVEMVTMTKTGLHVRVWERGVGETLACGTGAVACAYAAQQSGLMKKKTATVMFKGGKALVDFDKSNEANLTASAAVVFEGDLLID